MPSTFDEINGMIDSMEAIVRQLERRADEEREIDDRWRSRHAADLLDVAEPSDASPSSAIPQVPENTVLPRPRVEPKPRIPTSGLLIGEAAVNSTDLVSRRIVSHNGADQRSRPYDMLRTQVLRSMDEKGWKILGVTSPTPGCGKTLTAINLAFSIARQPDQAVVLVDMDLQKPRISNCLGLKPVKGGVLDLLKGRTTLQSVATWVRAGNQRIVVVPTAETKESSELMGSPGMRDVLQDVRDAYPDHIIILDLPPILPSDDVIAVLPQIDCVLLVTAAGLSKVSEVVECQKHLQSSQLLRVVVNKVTGRNSNYYYY
jgi:protein-tyrosine kinase